MKPFNGVQTMVNLVRKQISSYLYQNGTTYELFPYKSYMHNTLNACKQMTDV